MCLNQSKQKGEKQETRHDMEGRAQLTGLDGRCEEFGS